MTTQSLVPMSARAAGLSYEQLCLQLVASAALDTPQVDAWQPPAGGTEEGTTP